MIAFALFWVIVVLSVGAGIIAVAAGAIWGVIHYAFGWF
jgi:hypothetical protein